MERWITLPSSEILLPLDDSNDDLLEALAKRHVAEIIANRPPELVFLLNVVDYRREQKTKPQLYLVS